ncbi:astacin [Teladorsagia circumcincta]|uniref:Metalloendopeptidase n=1 Tax=Teladorsagia circumcincta TaxID=45464 RepID=A0A2G9UM09_TELCI|nr:astacin [Teladorsagia circumcincta]
MSRQDRDKFIVLNYANFKSSYHEKPLKEGTQTFDLPYDYGSIMHYGVWSVSISKTQPAMMPFDLDYGYTLGSPFVSFIDLAMVNALYGCKEMCDSATSVDCKMRGFPNPRNCSKCVCPGGYGGDQCTERNNNHTSELPGGETGSPSDEYQKNHHPKY